jgi:hypothetical protein
VNFDTVEMRLLPPSVSLVNVRVGNDPRLGIPVDQPLLTAEQISIGGGRSLSGGELRLGKIRALRPNIRLVQLADGRWNLPPGLSGPTRQGGIKVRIGSLLVQEGILELEGRRINVNARLEEFALEVNSRGPDRYGGTVVARRGTFQLPKKEPIVAALGFRFRLEPGRGLTVDDLRLDGAFGRLVASGSLEERDPPRLGLLVSADLSIEEVERILHSPLGFEGRARLRARVDVPVWRRLSHHRHPRVGPRAAFSLRPAGRRRDRHREPRRAHRPDRKSALRRRRGAGRAPHCGLPSQPGADDARRRRPGNFARELLR